MATKLTPALLDEIINEVSVEMRGQRLLKEAKAFNTASVRLTRLELKALIKEVVENTISQTLLAYPPPPTTPDDTP